LFGFAVRNAGSELSYEKRWALNREEEKKGFEWIVDEIMRRRKQIRKCTCITSAGTSRAR